MCRPLRDRVNRRYRSVCPIDGREETVREFMSKPTMALLFQILACSSVLAQPPTRKFDDPGAPPFKVLKEGENPPLDAFDNFVIGPVYVSAPERDQVDGVPEGRVQQF